MTAETKIFTPLRPPQPLADTPTKPAGMEILHRLGLVKNRTELVAQIHHGFRVTVIEKLANELQLPLQTLLKVARIAPATLTRRRKSTSRLLSAEESDRIYRIASAYGNTVQLFEGDADSARRWLSEPAKALAGNSPLQYLDTEAGANEVRDLIGRLEHGVYT